MSLPCPSKIVQKSACDPFSDEKLNTHWLIELLFSLSHACAAKASFDIKMLLQVFYLLWIPKRSSESSVLGVPKCGRSLFPRLSCLVLSVLESSAN